MASRKTWLVAIESILAASDRPLGSREIAEIAFAEGLAIRRSGTPEYSVQAAISRDLRRGRRELSPFVVLGSGQEARRYWLKSKADIQ